MLPQRIKRVSNLLMHEISNIIREEIKDPRVRFVTVTEVRVSKDLSTARVYVSILDDDKKKRLEILKILKNANSFVRSLMLKKLYLKRIPELNFVLDDSLERGNRVLELLEKIEKEAE